MTVSEAYSGYGSLDEVRAAPFPADERASLADAIMRRTGEELRCTAQDIRDELRIFPEGPEPDRELRDASMRLAAMADAQERMMIAGGGDVVLDEVAVGFCRALARCSRAEPCGELIVRSTKALIDRNSARHLMAILLPLLTGSHGWGIVGTDEALTVDVVHDGDAVLVRTWDRGDAIPDRERLGGSALMEAVWASGGRFVSGHGSEDAVAGSVCVAIRVPLPIAGHGVSGNA